MSIHEALEWGKAIPNVGDALSVGLQVTVIGLIIVFSVLVILMCVLVAMKYIFAPKSNKKEIAAESAPAPAAALEPETNEGTEDEELIAVITAAVAASLNTSTYNLNIKSLRRVGNAAPAWNKAGLNETINSRF